MFSGLATQSTLAQTEPLRVLQAADGSLYLALGDIGWHVTPQPVTADDLAGLIPSGELIGAVPAPFVTGAPTNDPPRIVQGQDGSLHLVQGENAWAVTPTAASDDDVAALSLVGDLGATLAVPGLSGSQAEPPPPPPVPVAEPAQPTPGDAQAPQPRPGSTPAAGPRPQPVLQSGTPTIVSSLPRTGPDKAITDTIVNAFRMALNERNNTVAGTPVQYADFDDATAAKGKWDAAQEASIDNKAISSPDVVAYIGPLDSGAAATGIPILCSQGLAAVSLGATYPGLTKAISGVAPNEPDVYYTVCPGGRRNFARVVPTDDLEHPTPADWASQLTGPARQWYVRYKQQFNAEPDIHALYGYEAMNVVLDAMQKAGPHNRAGVRDAIMSTSSHTGALGTWSFVHGDISGVTAPLPGSR
jgi:ABC-type branched-subunit amino acid transport system substrate-binding protein